MCERDKIQSAEFRRNFPVGGWIFTDFNQSKNAEKYSAIFVSEFDRHIWFSAGIFFHRFLKQNLPRKIDKSMKYLVLINASYFVQQ